MSDSIRRLDAARDAVGVLASLLENEATDSLRLIRGYLDARRQLSDAFQQFASDEFDNKDLWRSLLTQASLTPGGRLPGGTRKLETLGTVHRLMFSLLVRQGEQGADAEWLRLLSGDAVHTERRLRELREAGIEIDSIRAAGANVYRLRDPEAYRKLTGVADSQELEELS